jgi:hypothetical protein
MFIANNVDNPLTTRKWNYSYKEIKVIFYEFMAIIYNKLQNKI